MFESGSLIPESKSGIVASGRWRRENHASLRPGRSGQPERHSKGVGGWLPSDLVHGGGVEAGLLLSQNRDLTGHGESGGVQANMMLECC